MSDSNAPPSYASLFGKLREAKQSSESPSEYMKESSSVCLKACGGVATAAGAIVCCSLGLALPVAEICIGSLYLNQCQANRLIPIFLIVNGVFSIVSGSFSSGDKVKNKFMNKGDDSENPENSEAEQPPGCVRVLRGCCSGWMSSFMLGWFIAGSVWVFSLHEKVDLDDSESTMYCARTVYQFAFWTLIAKYIVISLGVLICCCGFACCCVVYCRSSGKDQPTEDTRLGEKQPPV